MRPYQSAMAGMLAGALAVQGVAHAQDATGYPAKPVRVVLAQATGGATDIQARLFATRMSQNLGQQFIVDNRAGGGAAAVVSFAMVAKANPDGYTLLAVIPSFTFSQALYQNYPVDPMRDFAPISMLTRAPYLLVVNTTLPAKSAKDLIALGRAQPEKLTFGAGNTGSGTHLVTLWFLSAARVKALYVPYRSVGLAMLDLAGGRIDATLANVLSSVHYVKTGKLRALGISTLHRSKVLPDLPDHRGAGRARLQRIYLPWLRGARRHSARHREQARRGVHQSREVAGHRREALGRWRRADRQHAGGIPQAHRRRDPGLAKARPRKRHQGRVTPRMRHRRFCAAIALVAGCAPLTSAAQDYPAKPVRVVVGLAPGGATDIQARLFAQKMSEKLRRPFLVENRTGAGSLIAFGQVAKAPADGYTLLVTTPAFTIAPSLHAKLAFDPVRDFTPVSLVTRAPYLLLAHPSVPVKSLKEFMALARSRPGALNVATSGHGATIHFATLWLENAARIKLTSVPYKGTGPALGDLVAGQVHATFANVLSVLPYLKAGRLRALAVTSSARAPVLPELPTFAESGLAGYDVTTWHAWVAPAGTPAAVVNLVRDEVVLAVRAPDIAERLIADGGEIVGSSPAELGTHLASEITRWRRIAAETGVRLE